MESERFQLQSALEQYEAALSDHKTRKQSKNKYLFTLIPIGIVKAICIYGPFMDKALWRLNSGNLDLFYWIGFGVCIFLIASISAPASVRFDQAKKELDRTELNFHEAMNRLGYTYKSRWCDNE